jgi:hypothetical protein
MRDLEERFQAWCQWQIGNCMRGEKIVDSAKKYEFLVKSIHGNLELIGMLIAEVQKLNRRYVDGFERIDIPGGRSIRGEVSRDG